MLAAMNVSTLPQPGHRGRGSVQMSKAEPSLTPATGAWALG